MRYLTQKEKDLVPTIAEQLEVTEEQATKIMQTATLEELTTISVDKVPHFTAAMQEKLSNLLVVGQYLHQRLAAEKAQNMNGKPTE